MNIIKILISVLWIIWVIYWLVAAVGVKQNIRNHNWLNQMGLRLLIIIIVIIILHVPTLRYFFLNSGPLTYNPILSILGFILVLVGFIVAVWARISLGKNWGMPMTLKEKPELVTNGPYAYIRHPIYTGIISAMLGTILAVTLVWVAPFIIFTVYFIYSLKTEEKNMMKEFPKEYPAYKKHTKALIPFVY